MKQNMNSPVTAMKLERENYVEPSKVFFDDLRLFATPSLPSLRASYYVIQRGAGSYSAIIHRA